MAAANRAGESGRTSVRVDVRGAGRASVATGLPVLDHLLGLTASYAGFDLALEVAPGDVLEEVAAAGRALGESLVEPLGAAGAPGHGSGVVPAAEALAQVALETGESPLVVSNVDLSAARVGGLGSDVVARFLQELATGARLTLHVRLLEGRETQHVLDAIFKALGVALGEACRPTDRRRNAT